MYHSVTNEKNSNSIDPDYAIDISIFEKQMKYLSRHRNVISMSDLMDTLLNGKTPKRGTVIITFDDGYLDNFHLAAPILKKYNLPATIYLATGYITRRESQWIDQLFHMFKNRTNNNFKLNYNDNTIHYNLNKRSELQKAKSIISSSFIESDYESRSTLLTHIENELRPSTELPITTLGWDNVREMTAEYPNIELVSIRITIYVLPLSARMQLLKI